MGTDKKAGPVQEKGMGENAERSVPSKPVVLSGIVLPSRLAAVPGDWQESGDGDRLGAMELPW